MVGADQQRLAFAGEMLQIVTEHETGPPRNLAPIAQDAKVYIEGQATVGLLSGGAQRTAALM